MSRTWFYNAMNRITQRRQCSGPAAARKLAVVAVLGLCALPVPRAHADGVLLVTSHFNNRVLRYDATTGAFLDVFVPSGGGGLGRPDLGIVLGPDGNLYVDSTGTSAVLRYNSVTGAAAPSPGNGGALFVAPGSGGLRSPEGLVFGSTGNLFVAANTLPAMPGSIKEYDGRTGAYLRNFVSPGSGGLSQANDLHFGPDGNLYVSSLDNGRVLRYDAATGAPLPARGRTEANFIAPGSGGLLLANGFAFGPDGNLYVGNDPSLSGLGSILRYSGTTGDFLDVFVAPGSGGVRFIDGIAFGPDDNLYAADFNGNRILRFDGMTGAFAGVFASGGGLDGAAGLAFAPISEPGSLALLGLGALGLLGYSWRRRKQIA